MNAPTTDASLAAMLAATSQTADFGAQLETVTARISELSQQTAILSRAASRNGQRIAHAHGERLKKSLAALSAAAQALSQPQAANALGADWAAYLRDRAERLALTLDVLRERGDIAIEHEGSGCPPVLIYDYEIAMDGATLERPCNYMLLRILPPESVSIDLEKQPYVIIDPRAGHGAGIGGFKQDSQVGVALKAGNPVYFVAFRRDPVAGQTLADVTRAEAEFVREVQRRHPAAPKPVVVGNCQGGWATLLLAATNPDLTGPIVLNGAPVAPWSGEVGENPMRYNGGVLGGTWQPMFWSDIGGGIFDGAHLVMNFELLNPSRAVFKKYYDLFAKVDTERERFLEFERWWGGFFLLNEQEIRWIVEQLFVGNRLVRGLAQLEPGRTVDIKAVRSPIIVFASRGDNITPIQQALNWIPATYADVEEIRIRGQRIVYMVHEEVGHLGIFVSGSIAKKEHTEMASVMEAIEALAPGLYEMKIEAVTGAGQDRAFTVSLDERELSDIDGLDDGRGDERPFAAVARLSEAQADFYDAAVRPFVRAMVSAPMAEAGRALHPLRIQRKATNSRNPLMAPVQMAAERIRADRHAVARDNLFAAMEAASAQLVEQAMDFTRDLRDMAYELTFFTLWGNPWARAYGWTHAAPRTLKNPAELRGLPEATMALARIREGGFPEAVIRMLVLLAESRGGVRRDRLARSASVLTTDEPFASMNPEQRALMIREQTLIATLAPEEAVATLPDLLPDPAEREKALAVVRYIPGRIDEMAPHTLETLHGFAETLGLPRIAEDVLEDPLAG